MKTRSSKGLIAIVILTILMSFIALPDATKAKFPENGFFNWLRDKNLTLGLDLQGGTQLDYKVDLTQVEAYNNDDDPTNDRNVNDVVEGIMDTFERRVNNLGVSEPNIFRSSAGEEEHIIVELAGIRDIEQAKKAVGKTVALEFKELRNPEDEPNDPEVALMEAKANESLQEVAKSNVDFETYGKSLSDSSAKIDFRDSESFESDLNSGYAEVLPKMEVGQIHDQLVKGAGEFTVGEDGSLQQIETLRLVKLTDKETREKTDSTPEQVQASHILIAYQGAERAAEDITRTQEEAKAEADRLLGEIRSNPDRFEDLAREFSDDSSGEQGGDLGLFGKGQMTPAFEEAAFALEVGQVSEVVETDFGYHIIKLTDKKEATETKAQQSYYTYQEILFDVTPSPWKSTGLDGSQFKYSTITYDQFGMPQVNIEFTAEGAKLFEELTGRLVGQRMAIFVGGELITDPMVNEKIPGGQAMITGSYTLQEASKLSNDLNTGALDAPIVLAGQYTISATLGDNALDLSVYAGIIGFILVALFMIAYYRLMGFFAVLALVIYSVILIFLLKTTPLVMTLAGIAGIILSIGMAVDANILIFERTKEELKNGQSFAGAVETGFRRAWDSIRDSNVSSLITCAILFFFGNSIIKGFAVMLAIGILISMFTAITVTRAFLRTIVGTRLSRNDFLVGVKRQ